MICFLSFDVLFSSLNEKVSLKFVMCILFEFLLSKCKVNEITFYFWDKFSARLPIDKTNSNVQKRP